LPQDRSQRPPRPPPQRGTYFLGRYRVVNEIGVGGMASVHLARMDGPGGFQKWVAIKRIHPHLIHQDSSVFVRMFLDEARVAARISHPNVATVFELGKHEDTYWIAMEYLHGEPLREVMRKTDETGTPTPPEIACRVIADAAEGLHAAHELLGNHGEILNLIHRDVTPHNLFVTYEGTTKVVDFGIAKFTSRMSSTRAGTLKGKLAYMSPEQVQGEPIDRRTDIFALGVVLWELTTGQRLFRTDRDLDTLRRVQECAIPRPSSIVRGYPIDLEKILMKALAKNRAERFMTAREFSRTLQAMLMRRGLFVASDEVASYMQSIFKDRIRQREAQLSWPGEVTQTISADPLAAAAEVDQERITLSLREETQDPTARVRQPPRPAAGVPVSSLHREQAARPSGTVPSSAFFVPFVAPFAERAPLPPVTSPPRAMAPARRPLVERDDLRRAATGDAVSGSSGFGENVDSDDTLVTTPLGDDGVRTPPGRRDDSPSPALQKKKEDGEGAANVLAAKRLPTVTVLRGAAPSSRWARRGPLWAAAILTGGAIVLLGGAIFSVVSVAPPASWTTSAPKASNDRAPSGLLTVICVPGCESVYDNGELLGSSPIFKHPATLGSHRIRLVSSHPDVEKVISTIVVEDSVAVVRESMP
jgi:serine/threonine protein kinase